MNLELHAIFRHVRQLKAKREELIGRIEPVTRKSNELIGRQRAMRIKQYCREIGTRILASLLLGLVGSTRACIGGGAGGVCCPASVPACAPAIPVCSSTSYFSSSSGGGSYAAPYASYPRSLGYATIGCTGTAAGCVSSALANSQPASSYSLNSYAAVNKYPSAPPLFSYQNAIAPIASSYNVPLSYQTNVPAPADSYHPPPPDPVPGPELESTYEDLNQEHSATQPQTDFSYQSVSKTQQQRVEQHQMAPDEQQVLKNQSENSAVESVAGYGEPAPQPIAAMPSQAAAPYEKSGSAATQTDNSVTENASALATEYGVSAVPENSGVQLSPADTSALNCEDAELRQIVESALQSAADNLSVARKIESDAAARFGGRFNSIVSSSEFAYVNWYGKRNCQLRVNNRHSLTWED